MCTYCGIMAFLEQNMHSKVLAKHITGHTRAGHPRKNGR